MSTAAVRDDTIAALATALEQTLTDGVAAFREGEVRATLEKAGDLAAARHQVLITNGYVYRTGRYKGTLKVTDEALKEYPGTSSQALSDLVHLALQERTDRTIFFQSGADTKTDQDVKSLARAAEILDREINRLGVEHSDRDTFEAVRATLHRSNIFRTTARTFR